MSVVIKRSSNDNFFVQNDEVFTQTPLFDDFLITTWEQQEKNQKFRAYSSLHFSLDEVLTGNDREIPAFIPEKRF